MFWTTLLAIVFTFLYVGSYLSARPNVDRPYWLFYLIFFITMFIMGNAYFMVWAGTNSFVALVFLCMSLCMMTLNYVTLFLFAKEKTYKPTLYVVSSLGLAATFIALFFLNF